MTKQEKLTKLIEIAVENGFTFLSEDDPYIIYCMIDSSTHKLKCYKEILFSHDFAKAIWGEEEEKEKSYVCPKCGYCKTYSKHDERTRCPYDGRKLKIEDVVIDVKEYWKYHLKEAVISKDPLEYYWKNK